MTRFPHTAARAAAIRSGLSDREIADRFGRTIKAVQHARIAIGLIKFKKTKAFQEERAARLRAAFKPNIDLNALAASEEMSVGALLKCLERLGLRLRSIERAAPSVEAQKRHRARVLTLARTMSPQDIAVAVGSSASAVQSIIYRYGPKAGLAKPARAEKREFVQQSAVAVVEPFAPFVINDLSSERVAAVMDLKLASCRWPIDDDGSFRFCGEPQAERRGGTLAEPKRQPYCACHCQIAFVQPKARVFAGEAA